MQIVIPQQSPVCYICHTVLYAKHAANFVMQTLCPHIPQHLSTIGAILLTQCNE